MKKYLVAIPIAGTFYIEVEAENAEDAKDVAFDKVGVDGPEAGTAEWEFFERITTGNILHAPQNEIYATESKN
jgi:hypothetical protein